MTMSPAASSGASCASTRSTTAAGTMTQTARGGVNAATSSCRLYAPVIFAPSVFVSARVFTASARVSFTTQWMPAPARRRAMLAPMRPSPIIPSAFTLHLLVLAVSAHHRGHFAQEILRALQAGIRRQEGLAVPGPAILHAALGPIIAQQCELARGEAAADGGGHLLLLHRVHRAVHQHVQPGFVVRLRVEALARGREVRREYRPLVRLHLAAHAQHVRRIARLRHGFDLRARGIDEDAVPGGRSRLVGPETRDANPSGIRKSTGVIYEHAT